jgi:hypothetical protein
LVEPDNEIHNTYKIYPELSGVVTVAAASAVAAVKAFRTQKVFIF